MIPENIGKEELMWLLREYDRYIQNANDDDRYREGWFPVCINEFYDCEFQEIKEDGM
jgi:hypothetical protein